jgi:hypothetical protein
MTIHSASRRHDPPPDFGWLQMALFVVATLPAEGGDCRSRDERPAGSSDGPQPNAAIPPADGIARVTESVDDMHVIASRARIPSTRSATRA